MSMGHLLGASLSFSLQPTLKQGSRKRNLSADVLLQIIAKRAPAAHITHITGVFPFATWHSVEMIVGHLIPKTC